MSMNWERWNINVSSTVRIGTYERTNNTNARTVLLTCLSTLNTCVHVYTYPDNMDVKVAIINEMNTFIYILQSSTNDRTNRFIFQEKCCYFRLATLGVLSYIIVDDCLS